MGCLTLEKNDLANMFIRILTSSITANWFGCDVQITSSPTCKSVKKIKIIFCVIDIEKRIYNK